MVFDRHASILQVLLESCVQNLGNLLVSLDLSSPSTDQVTVDGYDALVIDLEPYAHRSFVAGDSITRAFDFANLEAFSFDPVTELPLHEYGDVQADHALV